MDLAPTEEKRVPRQSVALREYGQHMDTFEGSHSEHSPRQEVGNMWVNCATHRVEMKRDQRQRENADWDVVTTTALEIVFHYLKYCQKASVEQLDHFSKLDHSPSWE